MGARVGEGNKNAGGSLGKGDLRGSLGCYGDSGGGGSPSLGLVEKAETGKVDTYFSNEAISELSAQADKAQAILGVY